MHFCCNIALFMLLGKSISAFFLKTFSPPEVGERMVPKNVQLQDETVLDGVVYSDPETTPTPRLTSLEQAVVLGQW